MSKKNNTPKGGTKVNIGDKVESSHKLPTSEIPPPPPPPPPPPAKK